MQKKCVLLHKLNLINLTIYLSYDVNHLLVKSRQFQRVKLNKLIIILIFSLVSKN